MSSLDTLGGPSTAVPFAPAPHANPDPEDPAQHDVLQRRRPKPSNPFSGSWPGALVLRARFPAAPTVPSHPNRNDAEVGTDGVRLAGPERCARPVWVVACPEQPRCGGLGWQPGGESAPEDRVCV